MSRNLAGILRVDAEARLQRECSQQTLSAYLLISNEDLAMAFMELLGIQVPEIGLSSSGLRLKG